MVPPPSRCTAGRSAQHPGATDVPHSGRSSCGPLDLSTEAMPVDSARDCYNSIQVRSFPAKLLMGINIWILYNRDQWEYCNYPSNCGDNWRIAIIVNGIIKHVYYRKPAMC